MRRSMKRLKTFKRPNEGTSSDPNAIPLEAIGGKAPHTNSVTFSFWNHFLFDLFFFLFPYYCMFPSQKKRIVILYEFGFVSFVSLCLLVFWFFISHDHNHWLKQESNANDDGIVSAEEETQATISEHITFAIGHLASLICKHSYVISNITMMVSKSSFSFKF